MGIGHETFTFFGPESYLKRWMEGREFPVWLNPHIEKKTHSSWLVASTRIWKIISKIGPFRQVRVKIRNVWNHHPGSPDTFFQASRQHLRIRRSITFMLAFLRCGLHRTKVIGNFGGCVFKSLQIVGHPKRSSSNHPFLGVNLLLVSD